MPDRRARGPKLEQSDWVHAGLEILVSHGINSVHVENIARHLNISKGSFYWHFRDRGDLLEAIFQDWEVAQQVWESQLSASGKSPAERWAKFLELVSRWEHVRLDLAITEWARLDPAVGRRVAKIDEKRAASLAKVFREIGFDKAQASEWARLTLLIYMGWVERAARDPQFRGSGASLAEVLSKIVLAASALASHDATSRK